MRSTDQDASGREHQRLRAVEFFCGIGGFAAAMSNDVDVVAAIDIDLDAQTVYEHNFGPVGRRTIESLKVDEIQSWRADWWWLSPPCQPYTTRGKQRGRQDPRNAAFEHLVDLLPLVKPARLAMENVPGFARSTMRVHLLRVLKQLGYQVAEIVLCPTQLGIPNRRKRYYLVASRAALAPFPDFACTRRSLLDYLRPATREKLTVSEQTLRHYAKAMDVVDAADASSCTACFTSAYGHSVIRSGSYLRQEKVVRRFSPQEVLALLGFSNDFRFPNGLSLRRRWKLAGNSLSLPAVRFICNSLLPVAITAKEAEPSQ